MANLHTLPDLLNNNPLYINALRTDIIQQFYTQYIANNVYIFDLSNNDTINLLFNEDQFCHLIGFSYFGYDGQNGWDTLISNPKKISEFVRFPEFKMLQFRILNFKYLLNLLQTPNIYIYKADEHKEFSYKSVYFALLINNNRALKLGIGLSNNGIHYGETYLVDKNEPSFNYYLEQKNLLTIKNRTSILKSKSVFSKLF